MDGERAARTGAEELIAELWAADPPDLLQIARPRGAVTAIEAPGTAARADERLRELLCALTRLGTEAELRAVSAPPSDLPALHVLAGDGPFAPPSARGCARRASRRGRRAREGRAPARLAHGAVARRARRA
jgi:hypothetical protein